MNFYYSDLRIALVQSELRLFLMQGSTLFLVDHFFIKC
jgi:hypothetical protein